MDSETSGHYLVVRPHSEWMRQAREALAVWEASGARTARDFARADYQAFCLFVEAWHCLGQPVSAEMMELAQMRPVDEVLGGSE